MRRKVLRKLLPRLKDEGGNALPIMAAAMLPIIAAIGAGVDTARIYMTKSKLQEAVDSAALAGRRAMTADNIETAKPDANTYVGFNFPSGYNGTSPVVTTITKPDTGTVRVAAQTTVPATFMRLFGYDNYTISVFSEAKQNFDNLDIVLVLDTTGSMAGARIEGLRSAVKALYAQLKDAQTTLKAQNLRLRYGIVPYSQTVNVGKLISSSYIQTNNVPYSVRYNGRWHSIPLDVNDFVKNNGNFPYTSEKWGGCIEERQTVSTITSTDTRTTPPSGAYDLDVDLVPTTDDATKWKPYSSAFSSGNVNTGCPAQATTLREMSDTDINTAVAALVPSGATYIDIGMIWGARLISRNGIFGSNNPTTYNQRPVQQFIIFMTDGEMNTPSNSYAAYGIEDAVDRVGGGSWEKRGRHLKRFEMMCNEAKSRKVSIWTIQFGDAGDTAALEACASNSDQFAKATTSEALIARFVEIGKNIGPLRLSK